MACLSPIALRCLWCTCTCPETKHGRDKNNRPLLFCCHKMALAHHFVVHWHPFRQEGVREWTLTAATSLHHPTCETKSAREVSVVVLLRWHPMGPTVIAYNLPLDTRTLNWKRIRSSVTILHKKWSLQRSNRSHIPKRREVLLQKIWDTVSCLLEVSACICLCRVLLWLTLFKLIFDFRNATVCVFKNKINKMLLNFTDVWL